MIYILINIEWVEKVQKIITSKSLGYEGLSKHTQ